MKQDYSVMGGVKRSYAANLLLKYHYLKDISKSFRSGFNFGLFVDGSLCGVIIFTVLPTPELAVGGFGLRRDEQRGLFELSRLCILPEIQKKEHNIASWFVSRAIRLFRKQEYVRAIISYADSEFHLGTIYRACNFSYYGLTDARNDFWLKTDSGKYIKHSRGKVRGIPGEWRPRSRKHRFLLIFDKSLNCRWNIETYEKFEMI